jgi:predicted nucleotide-binding protein
MPLTKTELEITKSVVTTFLAKGEASPRRGLVHTFEDPTSIDRLVSVRVLNCADTPQSLLPTVLAFHYCGDQGVLEKARNATEMVLHSLQNAFRTDPDDRMYAPVAVDWSGIGVLEPSMRIPRDIRLGLFLAPEFGVLSPWSTNAPHTEVTQFRISENIVTLKDMRKVWDEYVRPRAEQIDGPEQPLESEQAMPVELDSKKVFLVHGRDEAVKFAVARFLEKLGLEPVILHEQPNKGQTVIEKFEANSDVRFAVVLLTPDDEGRATTGKDLKPRARQNVILELGYFIGKLRRARVCALYKEGVDLPSDIHGVIYVPYDGAGGWCLELAKELKAAGIDVDLNRAWPQKTFRPGPEIYPSPDSSAPSGSMDP